MFVYFSLLGSNNDNSLLTATNSLVKLFASKMVSLPLLRAPPNALCLAHMPA